MAIAFPTIDTTAYPLLAAQRRQPHQSMPVAPAQTLSLHAMHAAGPRPVLPDAAPAVRMLCPPESLARHGGLVIAGRLEDVCAELDRLVAMEELH